MKNKYNTPLEEYNVNNKTNFFTFMKISKGDISGLEAFEEKEYKYTLQVFAYLIRPTANSHQQLK